MQLVGRARELEVLEHALDSACAGRGGSVLLLGEPGIGKTRLADEIATIAAARGARVAWGRAWDGGGAPTHWILREAFAALGTASPDAPLTAALDASPALDAHGARFAIAQRCLDALAASSVGAPATVLVLDDLHAAEVSSLRVLECMLRGLRARPVLIVMTARDAESQGIPELRDAVAALAREAQVLPVARLDRAAVEALVRAQAPRVEGDSSLLDELARTTDGNPLFLLEILHELAREPNARAPAPGGTPPSPLPMPLGVREAVRRRLTALDDVTRAVVDALAVTGHDAEGPALLARVLARPEAEVERALDAARACGVLVERAAHRHAFFHGLVREALVRDLPHSRREALHEAIAGALARDVTSSAHHARAIAEHLLEAGGGLRARAARAALAAAERADDDLAFDDAVAVLERALKHLAHADVDVALVIDVKCALGAALLRVGERSRGRALCHEAVDLARASDDAERLARAAMASASEFDFGSVQKENVAALKDALTRLGPGATHARVRARLAAAQQPAKDPYALVEEAALAIEEADALGDERVLLDTLHYAMAAMADYAEPKRRAALNRRALALAEKHEDTLKELRAHARLVLDGVEGGDVESAVVHAAAFSERAQAVGRSRELWQAHMLRALIASMRGRFDEAEHAASAARAVIDRTGDVGGQTCVGVFEVAIARQACREHTYADALRGDVPMLRSHPEGRFLLAVFRADALCRAGELEEARVSFEEAMGPLAPADPDGMMQAFVIDIVYALDDRARAPALRALVNRLWDEDTGKRVFTWGMVGCVAEGPLVSQLAKLDALEGDLASALKKFDETASRARAMGARPAAARALLDAARVLLREGPTRDEAAARARLADARALAVACAMDDLVARIDSVSGPLVASAPAPPRAASARLTMTREGDVWTIARADASVTLKDSRGLALLAALVARPGDEISSLDLASPRAEAIDGGDAGELLDEAARRAYRAHVQSLDQRIAEAEAHHDLSRIERLRAEREAVVRELSRAVGLGGRARKAGVAAERARSSVQRRIKDALERIEAASPQLAAHLRASVRTGASCVYRPVAD